MATCAVRLPLSRRSHSHSDVLLPLDESQKNSSPLSALHRGSVTPPVTRARGFTSSGLGYKFPASNLPPVSPSTLKKPFPAQLLPRQTSTSPAASTSTEPPVKMETAMTEAPPLDETQPLAILDFDPTKEDYELVPSDEPLARLGTGSFAEVRLAVRTSKSASPGPRFTTPTEEPLSPVSSGASIASLSTVDSPPLAPQAPTTDVSSLYIDLPRLYAVKRPLNKSCKSVLRHEAAVLTRLYSHDARAADWIIPFSGLDARDGSLVLGYAHSDLATLITQLEVDCKERVALFQHLLPSLAAQLVSGLGFMHGAGVVHGDIKPENIMLVADALPAGSSLLLDGGALAGSFRAVFADFNSAVVWTGNDGRVVEDGTGGQTLMYLAPERFKAAERTRPLTGPVDVWALGVTFLTLVSGCDLFQATDRHRRIAMAQSGTPVAFAKHTIVGAMRLRDTIVTGTAGASGWGYQELLNGVLEKNPENRITAERWSSVVDALVGGPPAPCA